MTHLLSNPCPGPVFSWLWPRPDHVWILATSPPAPALVELDDGAYRNFEPQFIERSVDLSRPRE